MVEVTDQFSSECLDVFYKQPSGDSKSGMRAMRAVLEFAFGHRQPKPEDIERLAGIVWPWIKPVNWAISAITPWENVVKGSLDHQAALGCARAILALYDAPPADFGMMAMADKSGELVMNLLARSDGISRRAAAEILGTRARIATLEAELCNANNRAVELESERATIKNTRRPLTEGEVSEAALVASEAWRKWTCRMGGQETGWQAVVRALATRTSEPRG